MSAFLRDDFTGSGAIGTPNWVKNSYDPLSEGLTKYVQSGGLLRVSSSPTTYAMYNGAPPSADYYVESNIRFAAANNGQQAWLGLRGVNTAFDIHGYVAEFDWLSSTTIGVQVWDKGGGQLNGSGDHVYTVANAGNFTARFQVQGTALALSLDGAQVWTGTDSARAAAGVPWIYLNFGSVATDVQLDYFEAGALAPTVFWTDFIKTTET